MRKGNTNAISPEARENRLVAAAMDLAEQQILDGTASSQVITHFLKLGTQKEQLEREKLREENKMLRAKTEALEAEKENRQDYGKVLKQFQLYAGTGNSEDYENL